MTQRSSLFLIALGSVALGILACSGSDTPSDNGPPLSVRPASEALCGGGATREGDGSGGTGGTGNSQGSGGGSSYDAGSYAGAGGSGGYGGTAGGSGGVSGTGGSGGSVETDAGEPDAEPPDADIADADCDADSDAEGCQPEAGQGDAEPDAESDAEVDAGDAGAKTMSLQRDPISNATTSAVCPGVDLTTPLKLYLSSDDSNSMASPVIVRSLINRGARVDPWMVRTYEFLNYYRFSFAKPPQGELAITSQLGTCVLTRDFALQIAVSSAPAPEARRSMNAVLVLDTSGSMDGTPIQLERAAVRALAGALQAGDVLSAVTWNTEQTPVMDGYVVTGPNDPTVLAMADALAAGGGTDLNAGLVHGYALAEANRKQDGINRVIIISDGQANVGVTDENLIGEKAEDADTEGIYLVGVGVGDGVNDSMMDVVTDAGRGAYIYLDTEQEAQRMFVDRFAESVLVAARAVQVELTLPPYFNIKKFYGEQYSPDPTKVRPQHLAPDDSMVFYQILHPCDPSLPRANDPYRVRVRWSDPSTGAAKEVVQDTTLGALDIDDGNLTKATAIIAYAELLKILPEMSGVSERVDAIRSTQRVVQNANVSGTDPDLSEIDGLLDKLATNPSTSY